jgi:lysophospholipase L1-like esterase
MGDSVAAGFGASQPSKGYAHLLFDDFLSTRLGGRLNAAFYDGVPGESSTSILRPGGQMDRALEQINDPKTNTKFVVIDIGGNDALGDPRCSAGLNLGACPFAANFARILDELNAALAHDPGRETLEVIAYYNPGAGTASEGRFELAELGTDLKIDCSGTGAQLGLNDLITCIGRQKGAVVADAYPPFKVAGQAFMAADGIHPNDAGHAAIAAVAEQAVSR